jgi:hypothetical protein
LKLPRRGESLKSSAAIQVQGLSGALAHLTARASTSRADQLTPEAPAPLLTRRDECRKAHRPGCRRSRFDPPFAQVRHFLKGALVFLGCLGISCRSLSPLPPADFSAPGWRVQHGQAVWKPTKERPELAGELLLATHRNGDFFVQFSKTPFTLATAQVMTGQWQLEFGSGDYFRRGRGEPPSRFGWFQLPSALSGGTLVRDWRFERTDPGFWRLNNQRTGESLEGSFFP